MLPKEKIELLVSLSEREKEKLRVRSRSLAMSGEEEENAAELKIGDGTSLFASPCPQKLGLYFLSAIRLKSIVFYEFSLSFALEINGFRCFGNRVFEGEVFNEL